MIREREKENNKNKIKKNVLNAALIVAIAIITSALIVYRMFFVVYAEGEKWENKISNLVKEDVKIEPLRGNIYARDGRLMASSLPQYYVYMDFRADGLKIDTLNHYLPSLCDSLAKYFDEYTSEGYKRHILAGYKKQSRYYPLVKKKISYTEMKLIRDFPFLKMGANKSGLILVPQAQRKKPFGSLASRTIGDVYGEIEKGGINGLELQFDSLLRGKQGIGRMQKVSGKYVRLVNVEAENGSDITSTIDIDLQDIT